ncbi:tetratricopeptide repeat-containing sensor histidine kinase [Dyadobacter psychrotolerans]|uniref:histidine kinase n=1 Tax=Dyadobacter psychrotolerans TaxID=2541721 RepID=A0A4R5DS01_9BACT|nr:tetratricopeptide repeat protein [Dyadobacter psychrotolerans]TDE17236.1 tetratricopeptide repeat protein [Dyadobacter psychrotolerans]
MDESPTLTIEIKSVLKTFLLVILVGCCLGATAQKIDSLQLELKKSAADTNRVNIFYELGYANWLGGNDSLAIVCCSQSVRLAKKLNFFKGEAKGRLMLVRIEVDRLVDQKSAFAQLDTVMQIAVKNKDHHIEGQLYIRKAQLLETNLTRKAEVMPLYNKALAIFEALGDKSWQGTVYNELGQKMAISGQYSKAIEFLLRARKMQEESGNITALRSTIPNLGVAYAALGLYKEALAAYDDAARIAQNRNDKVLEAFLLNQRAEILEKQSKYKAALEILKKAAAIHEASGASYWLPKTYSRMGRVYTQMKDFDKALKYTELGDKLFQDVVDSDDFLDHVVQVNYGRIYLAKKQYSQVIARASKGLEYAMESDPVLIQESAEYNRQLAEAYQATGDNKKALVYFRAFKNDSDSLLNKESLQKATAMAMNYEFDKKDQLSKLSIQKLQNEKLIQSRNFLIGLSVLAVCIAGIILWSNRKLRGKNQQLVAKNREIELALYKGQNLERKRVASELHDNLNTKLAALRWRMEALNTSSYSEADLKIHNGSIQMLEDIYADVRLISHNMLPAELETHGLVAALLKLTEKLNTNPKTQFTLVIDQMQQRADPKIEFELYNVVLELVNNIIKHAKASKVWLSLSQNEGMLLLTVSDNGVGFTAQSQTNGIGLRNISARIDALHGDWKVESTPDSGTKVVARVPV